MQTLEMPSITQTQSPMLPDAPQWFLDLQNSAWETYQSTPAPTRKNETWRFGDLKQLNLDNFIPATEVETEDIELELNGLEEASAQFIFSNEDTVHAESELPEGVICLPLSDALQAHNELIHQHLLKQEVKLAQ